jgi:hypothetical protein
MLYALNAHAKPNVPVEGHASMEIHPRNQFDSEINSMSEYWSRIATKAWFPDQPAGEIPEDHGRQR